MNFDYKNCTEHKYIQIFKIIIAIKTMSFLCSHIQMDMETGQIKDVMKQLLIVQWSLVTVIISLVLLYY